jgi:hypothetical protein
VSSIVRYQNPVDIGYDPAAINVWETIDVGSFMVDSSADGVILAATDGITTLFRAIGEGGAGAGGTNPELIVSFGGSGTSIEIRSNYVVDPWAPPTVYVIGEVHGPHLKLHDTEVALGVVEAQFDTWIDRQPTMIGGDALSDVAAVILNVAVGFTGGAFEFGIRKKGTTRTTWTSDAAYGGRTNLVGIDEDGYFQTYSSGKSGTDDEDAHVLEVGYILKTGDVVVFDDPTPFTPAQQYPSYASLDLSAKVPLLAEVAGIRWLNDAPNVDSRYARARATGGSETHEPGIASSTSTPPNYKTEILKLDGNLAAEYISSDATYIDLVVDWYLDTAKALLSGSATITAASSVAHPGNAALSGAATVTAKGGFALDASAAPAGSATVAATAAVWKWFRAALSGSAALSATADRTAGGSAQLAGFGFLTMGDPDLTLRTSAAVAGRANLTADGDLTAGLEASLSGSATVTAKGNFQGEGVASLVGEGALPTAQATLIYSGTGALAASSAIAADGDLVLAPSSSLAAVATLSAAGGALRRSESSQEATATLAAAGNLHLRPISALSGVSALAALGGPRIEAAAAFAGAAALSAAPALTFGAQADFRQGVSGSAEGEVAHVASAVLAGTAAIVADAGKTLPQAPSGASISGWSAQGVTSANGSDSGPVVDAGAAVMGATSSA